MSKKKDFGHAKNAPRFGALISACVSFGSGYHPQHASLQVIALEAKLSAAEAILKVVDDEVLLNTIADSELDDLFDASPKLVTRIINALKAAKPSDSIIEDANRLVNKLRGKRASEAPEPIPDPNNPGMFITPKTISMGDTSYHATIRNFENLIGFLKLEPLYDPNEADLKIPALEATLAELKAALAKSEAADKRLKDARKQRNIILYHPQTGLVRMAKDVKIYVKSAFGPTSLEYLEVAEIPFKQFRYADN